MTIYKNQRIITKRIIEKNPYDAYYYSVLKDHPYTMEDGRTKAESINNMKKLIRLLNRMDKTLLNKNIGEYNE